MKCKFCGKEIVAKNSRKTFCGQNCQKKFAKTLKVDIEKNCLNCGNKYVTKNETQSFCSTSCSVIYRHKDPDYIQKHAAAMYLVRMDEGFKTKMSQSQKIAQNKEETTVRRSTSMKKKWQEDGYKEKISAKLKETANNCDVKEKAKVINKEIANRPSVKCAKSEWTKRRHNEQAVIDSKSKKMIAYWSDIDNMQTRSDKDHGIYYDYIMPSGKTVRLQGFERFAIEKLLLDYIENDICIGVKEINENIGRIDYSFEDNVHRYYPDFYIKSTNTIIEVKSQWTFDNWKEKNLAKEQACLQQGFNFEFMIIG